MDAKILGFGKRPRRAVRSIDKEGIRITVDRMLEVAALIEAGRIAHIVVIAEDLDGEAQGFASYQPDCAASVLKTLNGWRDQMKRNYHGERD